MAQFGNRRLTGESPGPEGRGITLLGMTDRDPMMAFRCPGYLIAGLERARQHFGMTRSEAIRMAVEHFVAGFPELGGVVVEENPVQLVETANEITQEHARALLWRLDNNPCDD